MVGSVCFVESNDIAYYESNKELQGSTPVAAAQVVQWVSFADSVIVPPVSTWVFPTLAIMHHNKQATDNAKGEVKWILGAARQRASQKGYPKERKEFTRRETEAPGWVEEENKSAAPAP